MSQIKIDRASVKPIAIVFANRQVATPKTSGEHVIGYSTKASGDNLITDHLLSISASLQDSNSLEIAVFDEKLTKNDHEHNALVMQKFAEFIKNAEKNTKNLTLISRDPCEDNPWIDVYFDKYKTRKPINYIGLHYRDIMDLTSFQTTLEDIKYKAKSEQKSPEEQLVLNEARLIANNYNKTIKIVERAADYVKPKHTTEKKYPSLFPIENPPLNKQEYRFIFHVETSGYSYIEHGVLAIVACICDFDFRVLETCVIHFQLEKGQGFNAGSVYWPMNSDALNLIKADAKLPAIGIAEFAEFYKRVVRQYNPRFMSDNPGFHVGKIHYMFAKYGVNLSLTRTDNGEKRHIYDITSQQNLLQRLTREKSLTIEEVSKLKKDDHITLNKLVKMAHFESRAQEMYPVLEQAFLDSALSSLKEYKETTVTLLENNTPLFPWLITLIFDYLFVCGKNANHWHELQDNDDFFNGLEQIKEISKRVFLVLDQIDDPFYYITLGGGQVLELNDRPAHRTRPDFDCLIVEKNPQTRLKVDAQTLVNLKKTIYNQLMTLSYPMTENGISYWDGISFFSFKLKFTIAVLRAQIKISFFNVPYAFFLPMHHLTIWYSPNTIIKNIFTLNLMDILAGKIIALVVCDGIFRPPEKGHILVKNFFDIYMMSLFPEIDIKSKEFLDAVYRRIASNVKTNKKNCPEFCNDPLKVISDALDALRNNRGDQFGEGSEFAQLYRAYIGKHVYRCRVHTFGDTVNAIIKILTGVLNHSNYNATKYKALFECDYGITFWSVKPKPNLANQLGLIEIMTDRKINS